MRIAVLLMLWLSAAPALAAPTCEGGHGQAMRCGAPGAMPPGWRAPAAERQVAPADRKNVEKAVAVLLLLFALIALMPEFDGSRSEDWEPRDKKDGR